jgi:uncharacterized protein with von Willebrand factor type A (vWA) domain
MPIAPGKLAENIVFFARALRQAGLPVGPGAVLDALKAAAVAPFTSRDDFRAMLHAVFVKHHEHTVLFDQVFAIFWKRRGYLDQLIAALSPVAKPNPTQKPKAAAGATRVADALFKRQDERDTPPPSLDLDATLTTSGDEILRGKDFAQMSTAEIAEAMARIARLRLPADEIRMRRFVPDRRGRRIDPRRSFRRSLGSGGVGIELAFRAPKIKRPPVVAICDISGSVSDYSRVFLHFLHALSAQRKVHAFLFGTRLTNISRALGHKDVDEALALAGEQVRDWSGGTRIATSLHLFNKLWLRRVVNGSATIILFTDGLERDGAGELAAEMRRLHHSCRRLIWLNPLLRYDAFEARALGIRTMLPHVDEFRPIHNLKAVADLCVALGEIRPGAADPKAWLAASA